jgi:deazaflavin-dependent oxidoreductase (nitroreductase family)
VDITPEVLGWHQELYVESDGRRGHTTLGVTCLLLRTTGRRSGATRTNALVYARDGEDYLIVASNGGADRAPAWLHNLRADPGVEIQVGRDRRQATARVVENTDRDFDRLWTIVNENLWNRYRAYQERTARPIPVVVLTPT